MAIEISTLANLGEFDIELGVTNPRTSGVEAGEGAIGYATDNSRWVKVGPNNTDWEQILISTNGDFVVNFELANVTGTAPEPNSLGVSGGVPSIGDGITANGRKVLMNTKPDGYATMTSIKTSGVDIDVKHDGGGGGDGATGVCYSVNGGTPSYVAGAAGTAISLSDIVDPDGSPTDIAVWPATSATSGRVGNLTYMECNNNNLTTLDVSGLTALTYLDCYDNNLTTLDVSGLTLLTRLWCTNNNLTTLDVSGLTDLTDLECSNNNLTTLDAGGLTLLTDLRCVGNNLTTLNISGLTELITLHCYDNNLTQVIAEGWDGAYEPSTHYTPAQYPNFKNNQLTTDAVYEMLDGAATADPPTSIELDDNPCEIDNVLQDGENYTAAQLTALADSKSYALILN